MSECCRAAQVTTAAVILFFYISTEYAIVTWLVTYFKDTGILSPEVSQMMTSLLWVVIFIGSTGGIITPAVVGFIAEQAGIQMGMGTVVAVTFLLLITILFSSFSKGAEE